MKRESAPHLLHADVGVLDHTRPLLHVSTQKGASLDTSGNGAQWDDPKFLPFFKAAEQLGAVLFYHSQPQNNFLQQRIKGHGLNNSLGVILDEAIITAVLLCGDVLENCPDLKICIAQGAGRPATRGDGSTATGTTGR